jgi:DNA-binding HxlR family transcriptional regulator
MKKTAASDTRWIAAQELCDSQTEEEDALTREMIARLADKWTLWTMAVMAEAGAPLRFSRVMEQVEGISQKSLTKTLRALERDGLATRKIFAEVPPRVEYAITPLGIDMLEQVAPLWTWVAKSVSKFRAARAKFDRN